MLASRAGTRYRQCSHRKKIWLLFASKQKQQKLADDISEKDLKRKMQEVAHAKAQIEAEVGAIRKMVLSQKQVAVQLTFK